MKRVVEIFAFGLISCNGGNGTGSGINKTDTAKRSRNMGANSVIDSSAAALPTDTAPYKRK